MTAQEAYQFGLVNKVTAVSSLMEEVKMMAEKVTGKPALALKMVKHLVNTGTNVDLKSALLMEAQAMGCLFTTKDKEEGIRAFLQKRQPAFGGR